MARELIKTDKNGTKYYRQLVTCDRCYNLAGGLYAVGTNNNGLVISGLDNGVCWKCHGAGKVWETVKEYTPEHLAKLQARREAREAKRQAEAAKAEAEAEAKRQAEEKARQEKEAAIAAEKAKSQHVGTPGERVDITVRVVFRSKYEVPAYVGYGTQTMHIYGLKDSAGNLFIWKTSGSLAIEKKVPVSKGASSWRYMYETAEEGDTVRIKGTIKEHGEYKGEKQTVLTRVKMIEKKA